MSGDTIDSVLADIRGLDDAAMIDVTMRVQRFGDVAMVGIDGPYGLVAVTTYGGNTWVVRVHTRAPGSDMMVLRSDYAYDATDGLAKFAFVGSVADAMQTVTFGV